MVRTPVCDKNGLKKGTWTPEEDKKLVDYITRYGHWNWQLLPKFAGLARCGKSCRLRWLNYLRPNLKRGSYTEEEEETIIKLHRDLGNRWSAIAAQMPGRTDNEIKNHWHTNLKKRESQLSNSEEQSPTQPTPIPHPTQDSSSSPSPSPSPSPTTTSTETVYNSTVTGINNGNYMALEDEFGFLDSDTDLMSGSNFWLEPYMLDISYVPAEPDYFDIADNLWIWTHDN